MEETKIYKVNAILWAAGVSLTVFWKLNILKEAYVPVKNFLNFYPPVGPLLGLFIFSGLAFIISFFVFSLLKLKSQKVAFWVLLISSIVFFLMVFPPMFEPVVGLLTGK